MTVELAHITDPHLPLAGVRPGELLGKRLLGWLSWTLRRHRIHRLEALDAVIRDIRHRAARAHLLITGDLVNISSRAEFAAARQWLERLAGPEDLTLVPGNHDLYVRDATRAGRDLLTPWMSGADNGAIGGTAGCRNASALAFPFLRQLGQVALIGLDSSYAAPWNEASGRLGGEQLRRLEEVLHACRARGLCRVVLVHHPPLPQMSAEKPRKALKDAESLSRTLSSAGAELVLFGHTHRWAREELQLDGGGRAHVLSAPSASMRHDQADRPAAGWQHIRISRQGNAWSIDVIRRQLDATGGLRQREAFTLLCPT